MLIYISKINRYIVHNFLYEYSQIFLLPKYCLLLHCQITRLCWRQSPLTGENVNTYEWKQQKKVYKKRKLVSIFICCWNTQEHHLRSFSRFFNNKRQNELLWIQNSFGCLYRSYVQSLFFKLSSNRVKFWIVINRFRGFQI